MDLDFKSMSGTFNVDEAQGIVECFVAAVGNKDSVGDIVMPGAFNGSLRRRKPRVVWGHDWNQPIGKVLDIYEVPPNDPRLPDKMKAAGVGGLYARVQFNLKSERGREAFYSITFFGEDQEWSIGYKTLDSIYSQERSANLLKEVELYEVSPVLHGANQLTATISIKSEQQDKDQIDSFRKSKWKVFDPEFAEMVRTKHPDIWGKGGNIKGNDQYRALLPIWRKGKASSEAEINAMELREAWVARHAQNFELPGVVAQMKWLAVGSRGEAYMKDVIREAIDKKEQKGKGSAGEKGANQEALKILDQLKGILSREDDDFDLMLADLKAQFSPLDMDDVDPEELDDEDNEKVGMAGADEPKLTRRILNFPKGDCGCGCGGSCSTGKKDLLSNESLLTTQLSALLGRAVAFYFKSHAAHWNVEGVDFAQYHDLFGEIYADVHASVDGWAENIRKLGAPAPGSLFEFGMNQTPQTRSETASAGALARELIADNAALIAEMKRVFKTAEEADEQGVADFIASRIDVHQKWQWFLSASVKNAEIKSIIDEIETKAGRVIANRNMARLRQALDLLRQVVEEGDPQGGLQMKSSEPAAQYLVMDVTPESMFEVKSYLDDFADFHGAEVILDETDGEWIAIEAKSNEMMDVVLDFFQGRQNEFQIKGFFYGEQDVDADVQVKNLPFDLHVKAGRPRIGRAWQYAQAYDPNAIDGDEDGEVQDGTQWERPAPARGAKPAAGQGRSGTQAKPTPTQSRRNRPAPQKNRNPDALSSQERRSWDPSRIGEIEAQRDEFRPLGSDSLAYLREREQSVSRDVRKPTRSLEEVSRSQARGTLPPDILQRMIEEQRRHPRENVGRLASRPRSQQPEKDNRPQAMVAAKLKDPKSPKIDQNLAKQATEARKILDRIDAAQRKNPSKDVDLTEWREAMALYNAAVEEQNRVLQEFDGVKGYHLNDEGELELAINDNSVLGRVDSEFAPRVIVHATTAEHGRLEWVAARYDGGGGPSMVWTGNDLEKMMDDGRVLLKERHGRFALDDPGWTVWRERSRKDSQKVFAKRKKTREKEEAEYEAWLRQREAGMNAGRLASQTASSGTEAQQPSSRLTEFARSWEPEDEGTPGKDFLNDRMFYTPISDATWYDPAEFGEDQTDSTFWGEGEEDLENNFVGRIITDSKGNAGIVVDFFEPDSELPVERGPFPDGYEPEGVPSTNELRVAWFRRNGEPLDGVEMEDVSSKNAGKYRLHEREFDWEDLVDDALTAEETGSTASTGSVGRGLNSVAPLRSRTTQPSSTIDDKIGDITSTKPTKKGVESLKKGDVVTDRSGNVFVVTSNGKREQQRRNNISLTADAIQVGKMQNGKFAPDVDPKNREISDNFTPTEYEYGYEGNFSKFTGRMNNEALAMLADRVSEADERRAQAEIARQRRNGLPSAEEFDQMRKVGGPLGSQGGGWFEDDNGQKYLVKPAKSEAHAQNELAAHLLYRAAGVNTDDTGIFERNGKFYIAKRAVQNADGSLGKIVGKQVNEDVQRQARKGFAIDALASSWDVFGLSGDNVLSDSDGNLHRIDVGGSLQFRAQGGEKNSFKPGEPWVEPFSMRESDQGKSLYGEMSDREAAAALRSLENFKLSSYDDAMERAGIDEATREAILSTLEDRIKNQLPDVLKKLQGDKPSMSDAQQGTRLAKKTVNNVISQLWDDIGTGRAEPKSLKEWSKANSDMTFGWRKGMDLPYGVYASEDGSTLLWIGSAKGKRNSDRIAVNVLRQDGVNLSTPDSFVLQPDSGAFLDEESRQILTDLLGKNVHHVGVPRMTLSMGDFWDIAEEYIPANATPLNKARKSSEIVASLDAISEADTLPKPKDRGFYYAQSVGKQSFESSGIASGYSENPFEPKWSDGSVSENGKIDRKRWKKQFENLQKYFEQEIGQQAPNLTSLNRGQLEDIMRRYGGDNTRSVTDAALALLAHYQWLYAKD